MLFRSAGKSVDAHSDTQAAEVTVEIDPNHIDKVTTDAEEDRKSVG